MAAKVSLFLATLALGGQVSSTFVALEDFGRCPQVLAKSEAVCAGLISDCWSPGQLDLECRGGKGRCCFNGCIYTCDYSDSCETVLETMFENVTNTVCTLEDPDPVCNISHKEKCATKCETMEEVVTAPVESIICTHIMESVCKEVAAEQCVPLAQIDPEDQQCPVTFLLGENECKGQPPSDCWRPGSTDVDCEADGGYGLCCFNGCFNRCLKDQQCQNVTKNVCFEKPSEVCEEVSKYGCNPMVMTMTVPVKIESCSYSEKVCATKLSEVCQDFPTEKCEVVTFEACSSHLVPFNETTLELVCHNQTVSKCNVTIEEVCTGSKVNSYVGYECKKVPKESCFPSLVTECVTVSKTFTKEKAETICKQEERPVCHPETNFECRKIEVEKCYDGNTVCNTVETNRTVDLTFNVCMTINETICNTVQETFCQDVAEIICPECKKKVHLSTECENIPKEVCEKEVKHETRVVPKEVCSKTCVPEMTKECRLPEPREVCRQETKTVSYTVPIYKC